MEMMIPMVESKYLKSERKESKIVTMHINLTLEAEVVEITHHYTDKDSQETRIKFVGSYSGGKIEQTLDDQIRTALENQGFVLKGHSGSHSLIGFLDVITE